MRKRFLIPLLAIALVHLTLVGLGAAEFDFSRFGVIGRALDYYGELSGSGNSYGFFAPGVGNEVRARFDVGDKSGETTHPRLKRGLSHEADLRIGNIIDQFQDHDTDDEDGDGNDFNRSLAASLAGKLFARHPEARSITVHLDSFEPVSMKTYRAGERPQWTELYDAKFVRSKAR